MIVLNFGANVRDERNFQLLQKIDNFYLACQVAESLCSRSPVV
jgi:hypothetical protein